MNILFIDDEPVRIYSSIPANIRKCHNIYIAHGHDQICYYLDFSGIIFDLICCDHDMPLMNGKQVCETFLIRRNIPVIVHSSNPSGAQRMIDVLEEYAVPCKKVDIIDYQGTSWWKEVLVTLNCL